MKKLSKEKRLFFLFILCWGSFFVFITGRNSGEKWIYEIHKDLLNQKCANGDSLSKHLYISDGDGGRKTLFSRCILAVPGIQTVSNFVPVLETHLSKPYLILPETTYKDKVLILSPLRNAAKFLPTFAEQLSHLDYPHSLIRIGFAEEGSSDDSFRIATEIASALKTNHGFSNATVYKLQISGNNFTLADRRDIQIELQRRGHMARARNILASLALTDEKWILWIDVDVKIFRPDLIKQFLYSDKDVMVASALAEYTSKYLSHEATAYRDYDLNSFNESIINGKAVRLQAHDFKAMGREVPIQFVGACALMLRADCVRRGLHFPEKIIRSPKSEVQAIESEGLGLLARQMGFGVFVLPFLEVYHVPVY